MSIESDIEALIDLLRPFGRLVKRRRRNPNRLAELEAVCGWLPDDMAKLYERYDGIEIRTTLPEDQQTFFGPFFWKPAVSLLQSNKASRRRREFPILDEINFSYSLKPWLKLSLTPLTRGGYVMTFAKQVSSDKRYPAFDSLTSMIRTYTAAFRNGSFSFDSEGAAQIDKAGFAATVADHNDHCDYWLADLEGRVDFEIDKLERGEIRPREHPVPGYELLRKSGYDI